MRRRAFVRSAAAAVAALAARPHVAFASMTRAIPRHRLRDVQAITGDGGTVTLTTAMLDELRGKLRGRLLLAADPGYDDARLLLNPSFNKFPALVVQPTGAADVRTVVDFARDNGGLLTAVKCGGHSLSGQSSCDRGLQIDLSLFRDVWVDRAARTARVTGGSLLGQVDHEAMAHGLVTTMGTVSHTGAGGLVTGGGFGRLARRFGLSIDNLLSVDVVTADGQLRRANATSEPDLFWGVRGGGGNFGIVTSFEFRLHPMQREVVAGDLVFPIDRARDVLSAIAEYYPRMPDELTVDFVMAKPPGDAPGMAMAAPVFCGRREDAERALAPLRRIGTPISDTVRAMDYVALQRSGDVTDPRAQATYVKSGFIRELSPALISAMVENFRPDPRRATVIFFQLCGGAIARVSPTATAFAQRDAFANLLTATSWRMGDQSAPHIQAARDYWAHLERFSYGFYINDFEADMTAADVRANYQRNHDRLVAAKNRYDPKNLFRLNANIVPTA